MFIGRRTPLGDGLYVDVYKRQALDPAQAQACRNILRTRSPSQTVLFSTHSIRDAEQLAQHLLILNAGRVAAWSSPADLIQSMRAADPGSPVAHSCLLYTSRCV